MKTVAKKFLLSVLLVCAIVQSAPVSGAEDAAPAPPPATNVTADADTLLRNFLLLQDQLRTTQRAVEQAREQAQVDAKRTEDLLTARLNFIQDTLNAERTRELNSLQESTRTVIVIAIVITVMGFLGVLFAGLVQVRAMGRLAEVSQQLRTALPALSFDEEGHALPVGRDVVAANANLIGAIDRLQKRLEEVETSVTHTTTNGHKQIAAPAPAANAQIVTILGKGQALLNLDKAEEALDYFEQALRLEPGNVEAWIKKGTALERLQRIDEAIGAYDQAIAADSSLATAYLFKAGVYNRQKKYAEALQCYEKALSAQQKSRAQAARA